MSKKEREREIERERVKKKEKREINNNSCKNCKLKTAKKEMLPGKNVLVFYDESFLAETQPNSVSLYE